jgi:hypothetical protein
MLKIKDLIYLNSFNISEDSIDFQADSLKKKDSFVDLYASAVRGNGIKVIDDRQKYIDIFRQQSSGYNICRFVPASGAATRMFKRLISFYNNFEDFDIEAGGFYSVKNSFDNLDKFAFWSELGKEISDISDKQYIAGKILYNGLNYSNLPKALIKFHKYSVEHRTAFEEHFLESLGVYSGHQHIHFTVSEDFIEDFKIELDLIKRKHGLAEFDISFSIQDKSTDTISVDLEGDFVRDEAGNLLLRPGGHGSLLKNLNEIDSDIIFIKNIDNVIHGALLDKVIPYKQLLGGILVDIVNKLSGIHKSLDNPDPETILAAERFLSETFGLDFTEYKSKPEKMAELIRDAINKPIRVCGMVSNTGEPGGGPFWVKDKNGKISLQIIEKAQININNPKQAEILAQSTHFNPVDIVCYVKDVDGNKFNLYNYVDYNACFISEKTYNGRNIKVLEHPGLWNGAMADWLTIFVEVPLITFNPVKEVNDLLRPEHLGELSNNDK